MVDGMALVGIAVAGYLGIVVAFESLVGYMGRRHARRGVQPGETWLLITATVDGEDRSVVVAGVESAGRTCVAANPLAQDLVSPAADDTPEGALGAAVRD